MNTQTDKPGNDYQSIARRVTLIGLVMDLALGLSKIIVGILAFSHSLVADGIHSLSDAATDIFVLFITRISATGPDSDHPYGHARFETLGTVLLGSLLIGIALVLAYNNLALLISGKALPTPEWPALLIAVLSIAGKEWIFHYTRKAGEQLRSNLLIANAWHSRTDAYSSIVVLIGVAGSMFGIHWLDTLAAVVVGCIVGKIGWRLVWDSLKELVDTGLDAEEIERMKQTALSVDGVLGLHDIRSRNMGQDAFVDLHIRVAPRISVSEGHQIGEWVSKKLLAEYNYLNDVIYHIDAEDDSLDSSGDTKLLPLRNDILPQLEQCWADLELPEQVIEPKLHYLNNRISAVLYFKNGDNELSGKEKSDMLKALNERVRHLVWLEDIQVWYR